MLRSIREPLRQYWPHFLVVFFFSLRLMVEVFPVSERTGPPRDRPVFLELTASAEQRQRAQLYFLPDGQGASREYTETNSVQLDLEPGESRQYWFPLPSPNVRGLRLKVPGPVRVLQARLIDGNSREPLDEMSMSRGQSEGVYELTSQGLPGAVAPALWFKPITISLAIAFLLVAAGARWLRQWDAGHVFTAALVSFFLIASACKWNGSSSDFLTRTGLPDVLSVKPLLGYGKGIRADEFNVHTPLILHQLNARDPLAVESIAGPSSTILIANAPARHWSMLFRPQFWAFFLLPRDYAFAMYWQWKMMLLLGGTFAAFRLLTGSAILAIFGSLWYFISAYTQWGYSWPSLLPESIGLACLIFVAAAQLAEAGTMRRAALWGFAFVILCVDFGLCAYPPFQIPLAYAAAGMFAAWMAARGRWPDWTEGGRICIALSATGLIMGAFYWEIRDVVQIVKQTLYPGNRSFDGGGVPWTVIASGFADLLKSENHVPRTFLNICEGSGYLWFGPLTVLFRRPAKSTAVLLGVFAFLLAWMVLPIPAAFGKPFLLHMVQGIRVTPALGLVNIALTLLFLRESRMRQWTHAGLALLITGCAAGLAALLLLMDASLDGFFGVRGLLACALLGGLTLAAMAAGQRRVFAILVLVPLIWANLLINPLTRGLPAYEQSQLARYVREHPPEPGRWLVFSDDWSVPPYFGALGLEVLNSFQYVPSLQDWRLFDPDRKADGFYNGSGYTAAGALPAGSPAGFEPGQPRTPPTLLRKFLVDPGDPRLRQIRVRYFAHQGPPPAGAFPPEKFEQLTPEPLQGFTIYRAK